MRKRTFLFLLSIFVSLTDADEVETLTCTASTCEECLASGCGWVGLGTSACWKSCSYVSDISCYSSELFPDLLQSEICQLVQNEINDVQICGEPLDCATCVSTVRSDGTSNCQWYDSTSSCGIGGCFMMGCGSSTCSEQQPSCEEGMTCDDCLALDCAWALEQCLESCNVIADSACYEQKNFPDKTGSEICLIAAQERDDSSICNAHTTCTTCRETITSDGVTPCQWFVVADTNIESGTCCPENSNCGFVGPGLSICEDAAQQCDKLSSCGDCLRRDCAWIADRCIDSCSLIADIACYSHETFPNNSKAEICAIAKEDVDNMMICSTHSNCASCIETGISSTTSNCRWYTNPDESGGVCCPIGSSCDQFGPGLSTCEAASSNGSQQCDNLSSCGDCLLVDCAWIADRCIESCSLIADIACYSHETFPKNSKAEICATANEDADNMMICSTHSNCASCIETGISNNTSYCRWYTYPDGSGGLCCPVGSSCDQFGPGFSTCDAATSCSNAETCMDCLRGNCSWAVGSCVDSCSTIADAACYDVSSFPNRTRSEVCEIAYQSQQDDRVCRSKVDCLGCIETLKSDNFSTCQWYKSEGGYCGTGGCDFNGNCGSFSCDSTNSTTTTTGLDVSGSSYRFNIVWMTLSMATVVICHA
jgi:hypothetical protein